MLPHMFVIFSLCIRFFLAMLCARYAEQRGRNPQLWFCIGLLMGLAGYLALYILPEAKATPAPGPKDVTPTEPQPPDPRFQRWFFVDQHQVPQGPVPFRRLFVAWRDRHISQESLVWTEGMLQWEPIEKLPMLLDRLN